MNSEHGKHVGNGGSNENFVQVAVVTTSGSFPDEGFTKAPSNQKIRIFLAEAARHLNIADTSNWIARVNSKEIDPEKSYDENGLTGEIEIDFGPREGGGGNA
jgi:hypothetical protein